MGQLERPNGLIDCAPIQTTGEGAMLSMLETSDGRASQHAARTGSGNKIHYRVTAIVFDDGIEGSVDDGAGLLLANALRPP